MRLALVAIGTLSILSSAFAQTQYNPFDEERIPWKIYIGSKPFSGCSGRGTVSHTVTPIFGSWQRWQAGTPGKYTTQSPLPAMTYSTNSGTEPGTYPYDYKIGFYGTVYFFLENSQHPYASMPDLLPTTPYEQSITLPYNYLSHDVTEYACSVTGAPE
jgi:hypothetical protein